MPVVMGRQKRHLEPSLGRVFDANEKPEAKCADRERRDPGCNGVAAPAAQQPDSNRGREPRASNQSYIVPHSDLTPCPAHDRSALKATLHYDAAALPLVNDSPRRPNRRVVGLRRRLAGALSGAVLVVTVRALNPDRQP